MKFRIITNEAGYLTSLEKIVEIVNNYAQKCNWSIVYIDDGLGKSGSGISLLDFIDKYSDKENTWTWDSLADELLGFVQIYDMELKSDGEEIQSIACYDATFWEIECEDNFAPQLINDFNKRDIECVSDSANIHMVPGKHWRISE